MILNFSGLQVLSTRARKGVVISDIKVTVCTFGFDILYLNGRPLLQEQLKVRREVTYIQKLIWAVLAKFYLNIFSII